LQLSASKKVVREQLEESLFNTKNNSPITKFIYVLKSPGNGGFFYSIINSFLLI
jgi:hypothetical protein